MLSNILSAATRIGVAAPTQLPNDVYIALEIRSPDSTHMKIIADTLHPESSENPCKLLHCVLFKSSKGRSRYGVGAGAAGAGTEDEVIVVFRVGVEAGIGMVQAMFGGTALLPSARDALRQSQVPLDNIY